MTPLPRGYFARPFAHRALHAAGRPENGPSAVRAAVAAGYAIEIDVQPSADGRAMVFHDETLDRMTARSGPVAALTAADLSRIPLAATADRIPTLAEVLAEIGGRVPLVIEIKDQSGSFGPVDGVLERAVAADLAGYAGPAAVMSFNPHSVALMATLAPTVPRGMTTEARQVAEAAARIDETGAAFVSHDARDLANPVIAGLREAGLPILCWTIRSQEQADAALAVAHQITFEGFTPA